VGLGAGIVIAAGVVWLGLLFGVALYGERHARVFENRWAIVYALSLAVHCTSWTFYGVVTQVSRSGWWLPPTFVGAILMYMLGVRLLRRMVELAREHNASSLADLIAARLGRHSGLAALVTAVMLLGIIPYIALQLKAVAMSYGMLRASPQGLSAWHDSALYIALLMALFAMLFGTRRESAVAHNRGLVLAMAFESVFKLVAMLALGSLLLDAPEAWIASVPASDGTRGFPSLILLGAFAMFTMPHQFHAGIVECRDARHLKTARWLFPLYMLLIAAPALPLGRLGDARLAASGVPSDLYVLALPLAQGKSGLALFAFLGGLSAATSMVIVATLALSLMIANHFIAPLRVRAGWGTAASGDLRGEVLGQRRIAILAVILLAWIYSRLLVGNDALADIGALSFSALAGLAPAALVAVYWPRLGARAVTAGLAAGTLVWLYTILPSIFFPHSEWPTQGPFGLGLLAPTNLLGLGFLGSLARAVVLSLAANIAVLFAVACLGRGLREVSVRPAAIDTEELRTLATRFLPPERVAALVPSTRRGRADTETLAAIEHELASVIGASSARLLLDVAQRDRSGQLDTVAAIVGEASADLRFNQRVLEAALQNMSQGICVVDADLHVVAWNRRYAELFNYPQGLLVVGRTVADLMRHSISAGVIGTGDVEQRVQRRVDHMRAGTPHLSERRFPDGSVIEILGNPMPGGGYVATFSDVTAFRHAEQSLTRANETLEQRVAERTAALARAVREAERANETKSRFLAAVSHDLMQPLHAAQLFAHTLSARLGPHERVAARHLDGALSATESLLGGLLDIARLDGGRLHPRARPFALDELLGPLAAEFAALAEERGLRLDVVPTRAWIRSDPQLLRRVLQNFLSNALHHAERGRVLLGCRRHGRDLRIEVWDTGPGIAAEEQRLIFEEFRRGSGATGQGLGLGLAIAERMANLLGHALTLRSWPGRGSVFAVCVPLAPAQAMPPPALESRAIETSGTALIVDNEPRALAALKLLLESWGWRVLAARDGALLHEQPIEADVAIFDYHLDGGRTGLDLYTTLRNAGSDFPAIILTADRDSALRQRVRAEGLILLYKPLKPLALHQALLHLRAPASADA